MTNYEYYNKIINMQNTFNSNNIEDYQQLLLLIYDLYYNTNNFRLPSASLQSNLLRLLKLLEKDQGWRATDEDIVFNSLDKQSYINFILLFLEYQNKNQDCLILKNLLEQILLNANLITEEDIKFHTSVYPPEGLSADDIVFYFGQFGINLLSDPIITIKDVKIPNFALQHNDQRIIGLRWEFLHLLFKNYAAYLEYGFIFEEAGYYNIGPNDIVFDCGSNMGLFAAYAATKGAQVYCFEPMSFIRQYLTQVQELYPNQIHIIPKGLSDYNKVEKFIQTFNPGCSHANNNKEFTFEYSPVYQERVELITLDDFIKEYSIQPTFIKIDVEGSEALLLTGAKNYITKNKPVISICLDHHTEDVQIVSAQILSYNKDYVFYNYFEDHPAQRYAICK